MPIESVMPSNHLILCCPLLLPPSVFPSIMVFSHESVLGIRWPKYWSFSIGPSSEYSGLISFRMDWWDLLAVQGTLKMGVTTWKYKWQKTKVWLQFWLTFFGCLTKFGSICQCILFCLVSFTLCIVWHVSRVWSIFLKSDIDYTRLENVRVHCTC